MFEPFAEVPLYPLVFPVFWGAAVVLRPRDGPPPAGVRGRPQREPDATGRSRALAGTDPLRAGADPDVPRPAGRRSCTSAIFWGFVLLTIGTANVVTGGLIQAILEIPFDGALWVAVTAMQNVVAVSCSCASRWRSGGGSSSRPARLTLTATPSTSCCSSAPSSRPSSSRRCSRSRPTARSTGAFVSTRSAGPLTRARSGRSLEALFAVSWWAHIVLVAVFLCYLPFGKHLHIATAIPNIALRKLAPRGRAAGDGPRGRGRDVRHPDGRRPVVEGPARRLHLHRVRPLPAGVPRLEHRQAAQPQDVHHGHPPRGGRGGARPPAHPELADRARHVGLDDTLSAETVARPLVDTAIPYEAVWDCLTCGACVEACPVTIEHVDKIVGIRRNLVLEDSRFPQELTTAFKGMESVGNPWGQPPSTRLDWAKGLPFPVRTVAEVQAAGELDTLEVLYWVGCAAAFDDRNRRVARAVATCLDAAGVSFAVLGQEESCTGDPARRMGNEYVFQILAGQNIETLNRYRMGERTIVTACPHCFNTIGNEYGQLGGEFSIRHHSEYLSSLVSDGRLRARGADGLPQPGRRTTTPATWRATTA